MATPDLLAKHWDAIIAASPALLAAWWGHRNSKKIKEVHLLINSRMSELLSAAKLGAFGEGQQQERSEQERKDQDRKDAERA